MTNFAGLAMVEENVGVRNFRGIGESEKDFEISFFVSIPPCCGDRPEREERTYIRKLSPPNRISHIYAN
jgi:hypothetical protein